MTSGSRSCFDKIRTAIRIIGRPFSSGDIHRETGISMRTVKSRLWDMVQANEIRVITKHKSVNIYVGVKAEEKPKSYYKPERNRRGLQVDILDRIKGLLPSTFAGIRADLDDVADTVVTKHVNHLRKAGEIINREGIYVVSREEEEKRRVLTTDNTDFTDQEKIR